MTELGTGAEVRADVARDSLRADAGPDLGVLREIEARVLWLATRMIDHANRRDEGAVRPGGHQASSASMVSILTALCFGHLNGDDRLAVKPHASPVYHAIKYLIGDLDRSYLTRLRERGGLQAYPSRLLDPDAPDYSTGGLGLGAVAPLFGALVRRYTDTHFGPGPRSRFVATVGDAELDEGIVWEAIAEPACRGLGNVMLVVDLNRQSLDRVVPEIQATRLGRFFADAGWHVTEAKYGRRLAEAFGTEGGEALRAHVDAMSNEAYQSMLACDARELRARFLHGADVAVHRLSADYDDDAFAALVTDLGGHDLGLLRDRFRECDAHPDQPSVVFAYTVKGWSLPTAGNPTNHTSLLTTDEIDDLRRRVGLDPDTEWDRFDPGSDAGRLCATIGSRPHDRRPLPSPRIDVPRASGPPATDPTASTQGAFGAVLARLASIPGLGERIVSTAPDVSTSTNLGEWIRAAGVYAPHDHHAHDQGAHARQWTPSRSGRHIELGISEMNLFMLLGQLGLSHEHHGQRLLPIGTVYDPYLLRGLDALIYGLYNGARFVVVGTPSGVTLASEGGDHQSTITPSIGIELPGLDACEPAYATEVDWLLCDGLAQLTAADGHSLYLRLSTRPIDQAPFEAARQRYGSERLRDLVLAGGYRLRDTPPGHRSGVTIVTTGVMAPEALEAADRLDASGIDATVIHLTSADRVFRSWRAARRPHTTDPTSGPRVPSLLHRLVPPDERSRPIVSVHDAASHALAWLGSALGSRQTSLGVDRFGESGTVADLHELAGIDATGIVDAAVRALADTD